MMATVASDFCNVMGEEARWLQWRASGEGGRAAKGVSTMERVGLFNGVSVIKAWLVLRTMVA